MSQRRRRGADGSALDRDQFPRLLSARFARLARRGSSDSARKEGGDCHFRVVGGVTDWRHQFGKKRLAAESDLPAGAELSLPRERIQRSKVEPQHRTGRRTTPSPRLFAVQCRDDATAQAPAMYTFVSSSASLHESDRHPRSGLTFQAAAVRGRAAERMPRAFVPCFEPGAGISREICDRLFLTGRESRGLLLSPAQHQPLDQP